PDCTPEDVAAGNGLAVISEGNSISINNIPDVCDPTLTEADYAGSDISKPLVDTLKFVEDKNYCVHDGVDNLAILAAAKDTLLGNPRGASTLTMQLVRIYFGSSLPENDIDRKLVEIELAKELEKNMTKTEIFRE